jgi:hypothetical protein
MTPPLGEYMKKLIPLIAIAGLMTACDELNFNGQLNVAKNFTITEHYDQIDCNNRMDWWNCQDKSVTISAGNHSTEIRPSQLGQDKIIEIKLDGRKGQQVKITGNKYVNLGDQFHINAADIAQNFDIAGNIDTQVSNSSETSTIETCSEIYYERRCHLEHSVQETMAIGGMMPQGHGGPGGPGHGPGGPGWPGGPGHGGGGGGQPPRPPHEICETVAVTYYGDQDVRYYYSTTTKTMIAQFVQGTDVLATFQGQDSKTDKIYTYKGICRIHGRY